jgi:hypothetical protein
MVLDLWLGVKIGCRETAILFYVNSAFIYFYDFADCFIKT